MASIEVIPAQPQHADFMQLHARAADKLEFWASGYQTPRSCIEHSLRYGKTLTALHDGKPICVFGAIPQTFVPRSAAVWLVSSSEIENCRLGFLRRCRQHLLELSENYGMLYNYVDARYAESIKWLKWLGFEIGEPEPYGQQGLPFHKLIFWGETSWQPPHLIS